MDLFCPHCESPLFDERQSAWCTPCPVCGQELSTFFPGGALSLGARISYACMATTPGMLWILADTKLWKLKSPAFSEVENISLPTGPFQYVSAARDVLILSSEGAPGLLIGIHSHSLEILWEFRSNSGFTPPAADPHMVCAVDSAGQIHALAPDTGEPLWKWPVSMGGLPYLNTAPVLSEELILLTQPASRGGGLLALERSNGRLRWHAMLPGEKQVEWIPIVVGSHAFVIAEESLYRVDLVDGKAERWFQAQRKSTEGWFFSPPVSDGASVFLLAAAFNETRKTYALEMVSVETGRHTRLRYLKEHPRPAPAIGSKHLFLAERGAGLHLLDREDGSKRQTLETAGSVALCPPQPFEDAIFILMRDGTLQRFFGRLPVERLTGIPVSWQADMIASVLHEQLSRAIALAREHLGPGPANRVARIKPTTRKGTKMPETDHPLNVFLSHASEDKPIIRKLHKRLQKDGFNPWLDEERLLPGMDWNLEIEKALRASDAILLCFSSTSIAKEGYIQREYKRAMRYLEEKPEGTIFVIPVRLNECEMPQFIRSLQWVDYPQGYDRLVDALNIRRNKLTGPRKTP